jgi:hypothetical protein
MPSCKVGLLHPQECRRYPHGFLPMLVKRGVTRFPVAGEWGDVVIWSDGFKVELYQEFPNDRSFYDRHFGGDGHLQHFAYTLYNRDMREFVEQRRLSPDHARARIRMINDQVLALVLGGVVDVMATGAASMQLMAAMRNSVSNISTAVRKSPRFGGGEPPVTKIIVTEQKVRDAVKNAPLKTQQAGGVSLPRLQDFVDRLLKGERPPPIRTDKGIIVDGNHRYIAGRIAGKPVPEQVWAGGNPSRVVPWEDLKIDLTRWLDGR